MDDWNNRINVVLDQFSQITITFLENFRYKGYVINQKKHQRLVVLIISILNLDIQCSFEGCYFRTRKKFKSTAAGLPCPLSCTFWFFLILPPSVPPFHSFLSHFLPFLYSFLLIFHFRLLLIFLCWGRGLSKAPRLTSFLPKCLQH